MKRSIVVLVFLLAACRSAPPPPPPPVAQAPVSVETPPVATAPVAPPTPAPVIETRESIIASAINAYRSGTFRDAVDAFRRLGGFAAGEEHLRYYYAVALYETGNYPDAKKELACALPFIQVSEDVDRYRRMIEQMADLRASR